MSMCECFFFFLLGEPLASVEPLLLPDPLLSANDSWWLMTILISPYSIFFHAQKNFSSQHINKVATQDIASCLRLLLACRLGDVDMRCSHSWNNVATETKPASQS